MEIDYSIAGVETEANRVAITKITQTMHNGYSDVFTGIGYFKCTFSLQVKDDVKPCQAPLRHIAYVLQEPFRK